MNYDFINNTISQLEASNVFQFTFVGVKFIALALILMKIIDKLIKNISNEQLPFGEFLSILALMLLIGSSDFLLNSIEQVFSEVQGEIDIADAGNIDKVIVELEKRKNEAFIDAEYWYEYIALFIQDVVNIFLNVFLLLIVGVLKIIDLSITVSYLLLRVFYLQFLKFIFPLVLALSAMDLQLTFLQSWIKRYIGVYILGIAYIGIVNFSRIVMNSLSIEFTWEFLPLTTSMLSIFVVAIVVLNLKIKLFSNVTSYITGMFQ